MQTTINWRCQLPISNDVCPSRRILEYGRLKCHNRHWKTKSTNIHRIKYWVGNTLVLTGNGYSLKDKNEAKTDKPSTGME
ncbi:hypothetical protein Tco_0944140 [Tanacetum coccineum]